MANIPRKPLHSYRKAQELDDVEKVRAAARASYQGTVGRVSDAVKTRDAQRAERERQAAKANYLGPPRKLR